MSYKVLDTVALVRDLPDHGLRSGDLGAVVEIHDDALEVEFVRASGRTQALVSVSAADVRPAEDEDLLTVRPIGRPPNRPEP